MIWILHFAYISIFGIQTLQYAVFAKKHFACIKIWWNRITWQVCTHNTLPNILILQISRWAEQVYKCTCGTFFQQFMSLVLQWDFRYRILCWKNGLYVWEYDMLNFDVAGKSFLTKQANIILQNPWSNCLGSGNSVKCHFLQFEQVPSAHFAAGINPYIGALIIRSFERISLWNLNFTLA